MLLRELPNIRPYDSSNRTPARDWPPAARFTKGKNMKDESEIRDEYDRMADAAASADEDGSKFRGMTYEQGLRDALEWVLGEYEGDLLQ